MKQFLPAALLLAAALLPTSTPANANYVHKGIGSKFFGDSGASSKGSIDASARVVSSIEIRAARPLSLGALQRGAESVIASRDVSAAQWTLRGEPNRAVTITVQGAPLTLQGRHDQSIELKPIVRLPRALGPSGEITLHQGATAKAASGQVPGTYVGQLTLHIQY